MTSLRASARFPIVLASARNSKPVAVTLDQAVEQQNISLVQAALKTPQTISLRRAVSIPTRDVETKLAIVTLLVTAGADTSDVLGNHGIEPQIFEYLLTHGARLEPGAFTLLLDGGHQAHMLPTLNYMFSRGLDPAATHNGDNLLGIAVKTHRSPHVMALLLQQGVNLEHKNNLGQTPLLMSISPKPRTATMGYLIGAGADYTVTDDQQNTLLTLVGCTDDKCLSSLEFALGLGLDVNHTSLTHRSALSNAVDHLNLAAVEYLLREGASTQLLYNIDSLPRYMSIVTDHNVNVAQTILNLLFNHDPKLVDYVYYNNEHQGSLLDYAIYAHNDAMVEFMLEQGVGPVTISEALKLTHKLHHKIEQNWLGTHEEQEQLKFYGSVMEILEDL